MILNINTDANCERARCHALRAALRSTSVGKVCPLTCFLGGPESVTLIRGRNVALFNFFYRSYLKKHLPEHPEGKQWRSRNLFGLSGGHSGHMNGHNKKLPITPTNLAVTPEISGHTAQISGHTLPISGNSRKATFRVNASGAFPSPSLI